jgi:hypothetical protein
MKLDGRPWIGFIWLREGEITGFCEHDIKHTYPVKCDVFTR